jgi:8-amino-7-oxononanoate synthase
MNDTAKQFEDYVAGGELDIFDKIHALSEYMETHEISSLDALGHELLEAPGPRTTVRAHDGQTRKLVMMASNSFLNLSRHPRVLAAAHAACDRYGYGMGAVPLYAGITDLHNELERRIARFLHKEDAILFPCGYSGNVGVISALCGPGNVVINDAANHASIFDGCRVSGADIKIYLHANMDHLKRILERLPPQQRGRLIVTDGVFSMDGDLAPLDLICALAGEYGARVMIDDAHGIGVVGPTGRGTPEVYNNFDNIDVVYGTLSKAPAGIGGYAAGSSELIRYLRYYARTYFFSSSIPAPIIAGLIEVFDLFEKDQAGRSQLWRNIDYFKVRLAQMGFDVGKSQSPIIPVMVRDEERLGAFHADLVHHGVFTNIVTFPAVRRKECRLRLNMMADHTREDLDYVLDVFKQLGPRYRLIGEVA